jgi:hypothetical protein
MHDYMRFALKMRRSIEVQDEVQLASLKEIYVGGTCA